MRAALPISAAAHAAIIAALLLAPLATSAPPKIDLSNAVEVVFAPPAPAPPPQPEPPKPEPPKPEPPKPVAVEPPPPPPEPEPPPPPPPVVAEPPPPAPVAETPPPPPPPPKPEPRPPPKPRPRPVQPVEQTMPQLPLPLPLPGPPRAPQVASLPPPAPAPTISADYRTMLSGWLETHKRYPDAARQRGEEGRATLRFRVDRNGRVLDAAVVSSTGFPDLDASVESMMRGAMLPPFPPSMPQPEIEVSVTIRFGLAR